MGAWSGKREMSDYQLNLSRWPIVLQNNKTGDYFILDSKLEQELARIVLDLSNRLDIIENQVTTLREMVNEATINRRPKDQTEES